MCVCVCVCVCTFYEKFTETTWPYLSAIKGAALAACKDPSQSAKINFNFLDRRGRELSGPFNQPSYNTVCWRL